MPTINGIEQGAGLQFAATDVRYTKSKNSSQLSMNIAKAYPETAGVKSWNRTVKLDKSKGSIEVKDQYEMNKNPGSITQSFMTVCNTDITSPGKIIFDLTGENKVYLDYDNKIWNITKEKMDLVTPEDQGLKHSWDGRTIWRILLTAKSPVQKESITYKIHK